MAREGPFVVRVAVMTEDQVRNLVLDTVAALEAQREMARRQCRPRHRVLAFLATLIPSMRKVTRTK